MTDELRVKDLPQEEKDALLKEAEELKIPGILPEYIVIDLKAKIEEIKKDSENASSQAPDNEEKDAPETDLEEDKHDEADVNNPYKSLEYADVRAEAEKRNLQTADKKRPTLEAALIADDEERARIAAEAFNSQDKEEDSENKPEKDSENASSQATDNEEIKFDGICCVCMQKVFSGKCSGCGRKY